MNILLVDDDPLVMEALTVGLGLQWADCTILQASDGETCLDTLHRHHPDVILLDIDLPRRDGLAVLQAIRGVSNVPVIMLSAHTESELQAQALELGADDYITKPFSHLILVARIRAVLRRVELPPPIQATPDYIAGDLAIHFQRHEVTVEGEPVKLTPIEYKLLYHLVRNAGRLLSQQALLERVWGPDYTTSTDYIKVFVSRLRAKLERPGGPHYIETERGLGYRFIRPKVGGWVSPGAGCAAAALA